MTYRRAVLPALAGGLLLTALLWWAGASAHALHLPGATGMLDSQTAAELERWLTPWSYDPPTSVQFGTEVSGGIGGAAGVVGTSYRALYSTALQIRFGAVFAFSYLVHCSWSAGCRRCAAGCRPRCSPYGPGAW